MTDGLGNKLTEGQFLWWKEKGLLVRILVINEPRVVTREPGPTAVIVAVTIVVDPHTIPKNEEARLTDFLRVVDPQADAALAAIVDETPRRTQ